MYTDATKCKIDYDQIKSFDKPVNNQSNRLTSSCQNSEFLNNFGSNGGFQ
tara:strand:- start:131 stop:280 length:150 start_codon:yes stop_codon:yes gene_type:complete